jgi:hypothetical protein
MSKSENYKEKEKVLNSIKSDDALYILNRLIEDDSEIKEKVYNIMLTRLKEVNVEGIASDVYSSLEFLDVEELWDRSGNTRYGYVDVSEEAWVMVGEAIEPFLQEMKKYQKLDMHSQAKAYCTAIIKGLQNYDYNSNSDFKDWAVDEPSNYINRTLEDYKEGNPDDNDLNDIMKIIND